MFILMSEITSELSTINDYWEDFACRDPTDLWTTYLETFLSGSGSLVLASIVLCPAELDFAKRQLDEIYSSTSRSYETEQCRVS
jgi:hypothetical protein